MNFPSRELIVPANPKLDVPKTFDLPYSAGVRADGFIFLSGVQAIDRDTGELCSGTTGSETRRIFENLAEVLEGAGSSLNDLVKVNVFLHSLLEAESFNHAYRSFFPDSQPARNVCGAVLSSGMKVEIDCVAVCVGHQAAPRPRSPIEPKNAMLNNSRRHNRPHSPGIRVGNLIFVSGMVPLDPETGESKIGPTREQVELVLSNMSHLLESAGTSLRNVVKLNVSMANMLERDTLFRVMRRFFPHTPPACTVVGMQLSNGHSVEIECIATA
jgi:2-iminobutanoate/2-iminopropanoate deaminase